MFSLQGDIKLWSFECDINIHDTDFGAFRYHEKRFDNIYNESKRTYSQERGMLYMPQNRKGNKLKEKIKYLEEHLRDNSVVYCRWYNQYIIQLIFTSGLLCYVQVNLFTGDIEKIIFDRFLVGKVPDTISDAAIATNHIICVHSDNQIIIVHFGKPKSQIFDKISKLEPKFLTVDLPSPSSRRAEKKICINKSGDLVLIWWKSTINEVYPWSPAMKEHDHANVHLYRLHGIKFELLCYLRTEFDPLCIKFNTQQDNTIHSIEQKVSRKGEVTIEWQVYGISQQDKLQRIEVISIPLPTHTTCAKFSPNQNMLLLCCIDGSMIVHDHVKRTNNILKAGFIPTLATWHNDGLIFSVGNERGQVQHYDISLSCIKTQLLNEDAMPTNTLDLSVYFKNQPALIKIAWNKKFSDNNLCNDRLNDRDALLLILFERGPIGVIRIVEGNNLSGDVLVHRYLNLQLPDRATSLLLSINWDLQPRICMYALSQIVNYLFKLPLCPEHENLIQNALSSFYVPAQSISQTVEDEYSNEVRDLTRKFFYHLVRHKLFEKAFRLAIDLNDHDLFMDIHFYAIAINDEKMASMAEERAQLILNRSDSCSSSHSFCSRPSCSLCSNSGSDNHSQSCSEESENESSPQRQLKYKFNQNEMNYKQTGNVINQTPPLPVFNSSAIPKLRISSFSNPTNYTLSTVPMKLTAEPSTFISKDFMSSSFDNLQMNKLSIHERFSNKIESDKTFLEESRNVPLKHSDDTYLLSEGNNSTNLSNSKKYSISSTDINGKISTSENLSKNNEPLGLIAHDNRHTDLIYDQQILNNPVTNIDMDSRLLTTSFTDVITTKTSLNNDDHLMSTSFNDEGSSESLEIHKTHQKFSSFNQFKNDFEETMESNAYCDTSIEVPPPPPAMTSSLANYLNSLPKKKSSLTANPLVSNNRIDKSLSTFPGTYSIKHNSSQVLQTQSSVSKILQNQCKNNCSIMRTCKFNYDLDCIQYSCSCEHDIERAHDGKQSVYPDALKHFQNSYNQSCKPPVESVLIKSGIFQSSKNSSGITDSILTSNVPPLPVINNGMNSKQSSKYQQGSTDLLTNFNEKPKVKFSNTVTHILVPEMDQPYQSIQKQKIIQLQMIDPEKGLSDNLISRDVRKNEDYLKDVQSVIKVDKSNESRKSDETTTIKVVHFGHL
ncbi:hypothetical protein PV326_008759 [Microctonus aethiopoides]|nr:hypothetical protein PV326_008759 [Microctonus aethiopoides]